MSGFLLNTDRTTDARAGAFATAMCLAGDTAERTALVLEALGQSSQSRPGGPERGGLVEPLLAAASRPICRWRELALHNTDRAADLADAHAVPRAEVTAPEPPAGDTEPCWRVGLAGQVADLARMIAAPDQAACLADLVGGDLVDLTRQFIQGDWTVLADNASAFRAAARVFTELAGTMAALSPPPGTRGWVAEYASACQRQATFLAEVAERIATFARAVYPEFKALAAAVHDLLDTGRRQERGAERLTTAAAAVAAALDDLRATTYAFEAETERVATTGELAAATWPDRATPDVLVRR